MYNFPRRLFLIIKKQFEYMKVIPFNWEDLHFFFLFFSELVFVIPILRLKVHDVL